MLALEGGIGKMPHRAHSGKFFMRSLCGAGAFCRQLYPPLRIVYIVAGPL
jgi:hypothetical protein